MKLPFTCPRSCRWAEAVDRCRFQALLHHLTGAVVTSHTAEIRMEIRYPEVLRGLVLARGGQWADYLEARFWDGQRIHGPGFRLPGWNYPAVLQNGRLVYDQDYHASVQALLDDYARALIEAKAAELGWMTERQADGSLVIYHPTGGTLTWRPGGQLDASGFVGNQCHEAAAPLIQALGEAEVVIQKPEAQVVPLRQQIREGLP
jgi:hypothetical protein